MKTSTIPPSAPAWVLIDAENQNIGRLSTQIATILRGKNKVEFSPHQMHGDHVVVINAEKLAVNEVKKRRKTYFWHTGTLGNLKSESLGHRMERNPVAVIEGAVKGMLPKNRLRKQMLKRLHVFAGSEHDHEAQKPEPLTTTH